VLGASADIGGAIIRALDDETTLIFAHYHKNLEKIKKLQKNVVSRIIPIRADLSQKGDLVALIEEVQKFCICPDKVVHLSAPKITYSRFKDVSWSDFNYEIDVELRSIILLLKVFLPQMAKAKSGKVVFMLTSYCFGIPPKALSPYITTKYALLGLMKSLAAEYADKGVTVNAVSPSMAETNFISDIPDIVVEMAAAAHPLKRNAVPEDIAPMVKFLLSKDSDYITGVNIPIAGGSMF